MDFVVGDLGGGQGDPRRGRVRLVAAVISAVAAVIYVLIGLGALTVVEAAKDAPDLLAFGLAAGAMFALGALLLVAFDVRALWALGALLQVGVIVMYVLVAPQRTPSYEMWGIALKVLQAVLLIALGWLAATRAQPATAARTTQPYR